MLALISRFLPISSCRPSAGARPGPESFGPETAYYSVPFPAYPAERFSRPWIAVVVDWPIPERPALAWGNCLQGNPGEASMLTVRCTPGSIIRWGIRDYKFGTRNQWWSVAEARGHVHLITAAQARILWLAQSERSS